MNDSATSLANLHDIVVPATVSWWPPAPGWYALLALLVAVGARVGWRAWKSWRAKAYRRAALRELTSMRDASAIAALLRRTALARVPRPAVAAMTGAAWADWLDAHGNAPMSPDVRAVLEAGVYGRGVAERDFGALRRYASHWIERHGPLDHD